MKKLLIGIVVVIVVLVGVYAFMAAPGAKATEQLQPFTQQPIAHRGYFDNETGLPENSLSAFERAIQMNYAIELDVQVTADGTPVVFHDQDTERMCGTPGKIYELTDEQIADMRLLDSDETIPTFADVLSLIDGQVPLLVEVKGVSGDDPKAIAAASAELLDSYEGVYAVQSFNPFALQWFKDNRPDVVRGQLLQDFLKDPEGQSLVNRIGLTTMMTNVLSRPNFISYELADAGQVNFQVVRGATGIDCFAWTLKSQQELDDARSQGFVGFIFDSFEAHL